MSSNGLVVKALDSYSRGLVFKTTEGGGGGGGWGGFKTDSVFHPSEVDKMSTKNIREHIYQN